ncbi:hypothetical protein GCM10011390_03190 [Aureimonas endophytica]|uniref:Threonine transporter n=1 Tax=Aureimonas endophytica TaxID=2027858 RepID=A0A916ZC69_9HYPH|nr:ABC-three component system middle component 2 [Aureimonas endophytica]GGD87818.1 hypothetical protein GCM10011390_03190 [Aureimonas endophytica]
METMNRPDEFRAPLFNSPLETGLRALVVLDALHPRGCDLAEMTWLDHLVVHTSDLDGYAGTAAPSSLHPDLPNRVGEILVRRRLVEESVRLMHRVNLVDVVHDESGIRFVAGEDAPSFLRTLQSGYTEALKLRADWLAALVRELPEGGLAQLVTEKIGRWTAELPVDEPGRDLP